MSVTDFPTKCFRCGQACKPYFTEEESGRYYCKNCPPMDWITRGAWQELLNLTKEQQRVLWDCIEATWEVSVWDTIATGLRRQTEVNRNG